MLLPLGLNGDTTMAYQIPPPVLHDITMARRAKQTRELAVGSEADPIYPDDIWFAFLTEHVDKLVDARLSDFFHKKSAGECHTEFRQELVAMASTIVAWIEAFDTVYPPSHNDG